MLSIAIFVKRADISTVDISYRYIEQGTLMLDVDLGVDLDMNLDMDLDGP